MARKSNTVKPAKNAIYGDMAAIFTIRDEGYLKFLEKAAGGRTKNISLNLRRKNGQPYSVRVQEINYTSVRRALAFHDSKRNARGRTPRFNGDDEARWTNGNQMWITGPIWDAVAAELTSRVGISKAQLAEVAVALGRPRPGRWVARHMGMGSYTMTSNPTVVNFTATGPGLDVPARRSGEVERFRLTGMRMKLENMVRRNARGAGFVRKLI